MAHATPTSAAGPIPAFVNPAGGSAKGATEALAADGRFLLRRTPAGELGDALRDAARGGARRVLVSGGDGTIAAAAAALAGTEVEIAVLPGGTLNHFARDHGIPTEAGPALDLAATGAARPIDAGEVNGRLFLNTSSVGAYVAFVRARERMEPRFGYLLSSILATIRIFALLRSVDVYLDADGVERTFHSPLVFVGVGERVLRIPGFGARAEGGRRGLHVVAVRGKTRARVLALALAAVRGFRSVERTPSLEAFLVHGFRVELRRPRTGVSTDGEIEYAATPLVYRFHPGHVRFVTGPDRGAARDA